jgi:hypothetical protein
MIKIDLALVVALIGTLMVYLFKNTCLLNNHDFIFQKNTAICSKCGLIKKVLKK